MMNCWVIFLGSSVLENRKWTTYMVCTCCDAYFLFSVVLVAEVLHVRCLRTLCAFAKAIFLEQIRIFDTCT